MNKGDFNLFVATPSGGHVKMDFACSLANFCLYYCTVRVFEGRGQGIVCRTSQSFSTSCNREMLVDSFLATPESSHLLFIDDDMGFDPDAALIMIHREKPIVLANYPRKKLPIQFISIGFNNEEIVTTAESTGLEAVAHGGFGFALIEKWVLEKMEKPRFLVPWSKAMNSWGSEDYLFCHRATEMGIPVLVDHDASKKVWHVGDTRYGVPKGD